MEKPLVFKVLMWNITSPRADFLFGISNWLLIAGAFAIFVGTIGSIAMGAAKDYFANERLSANELATERAKADAEIAKEGAAEADARAAEAQLALAKYRAGRSLTTAQHEILVQALRASPKGHVIIKPNFVDQEATRFANQITQAFADAGFVGVGDALLPIIAIPRSGVFLAVKDVNRPPPDTDPILRAFAAAGIPVESGYADWVPDLNTVVVLIGTQP